MKCKHEYCGKDFMPAHPDQVYCTANCNHKAYNMRKRRGEVQELVLEDRTCGCGASFRQVHPKQIHCTRRCAQRQRNRAKAMALPAPPTTPPARPPIRREQREALRDFIDAIVAMRSKT